MSAQHYEYVSADEAWADGPIAARIIHRLTTAEPRIRRVLDAGCGNGNLSARIAAAGFQVAGFDMSVSGIEHARRAFPELQFEVASAYDDLCAQFDGPFDACVCVEVIEHMYDPRACVDRLYEVLRPGGLLLLTTPYHGYFKNLALAITGKMDRHFTALWDGGHVKFWSRSTLTTLLHERGFRVIGFEGAGRVPLLWKSMILIAQRAGRGS
jgi:2-polyprenyl-3-methyl-5-hydroxy-6-metoxy-1,4-benzoquinol methylase